MNVITFIIRVLKLLLMQGKYILSALVVILLFIVPVAGSTNKLSAGAPVFIGESDVDISTALNGCHTIAWWPEGADINTSAIKNQTIYEINTVSEKIYHYNFSPGFFTGSTGTWYCQDKKPNYPVFDVQEPQIDIRVWDVDKDEDVTGKNIPVLSNITYRIDTNTYPALSYLNRPNLNPSDTYYDVKLTGPNGKNIPTIFTGSLGGAKTLILPFDSTPTITESFYYWRNGNEWDRNARGSNGELMYPQGTYTFTVNQNLNNMQQLYRESGVTDLDGKITKTASVTFYRPETPAVTTTQETVVTTISITGIPTTTGPVISVPTITPVAKKTTYSPLPAWLVLLGLALAGLSLVKKKL
jgi:hypothetical protein